MATRDRITNKLDSGIRLDRRDALTLFRTADPKGRALCAQFKFSPGRSEVRTNETGCVVEPPLTKGDSCRIFSTRR